MRFILLSFFFATMAAGQADVDPVLDQLDAAGKNLKSFVTDVQLTTSNTATGDAETRSGKVWYALDGGGNPRIRVQLNAKQANGKTIEDHIEYVLSGGDLIERHNRDKTQQTHHVLQPGEKIDLFKLGSGPFPLPIGQDKADVHRVFEVVKIAPDPGDPRNATHLRLTPKPDTDLARKFQVIDVWVDNGSGMPIRIGTIDSSGDTSRTTDLDNVKVNVPVVDEDFKLPAIDEGAWQVTEEKYQR